MTFQSLKHRFPEKIDASSLSVLQVVQSVADIRLSYNFIFHTRNTLRKTFRGLCKQRTQ